MAGSPYPDEDEPEGIEAGDVIPEAADETSVTIALPAEGKGQGFVRNEEEPSEYQVLFVFMNQGSTYPGCTKPDLMK